MSGGVSCGRSGGESWLDPDPAGARETCGGVGGSGLGFGVGGYAGARLGQPIGLVPCWAERPRGGGSCFVIFFALFCFCFTFLFLFIV